MCQKQFGNYFGSFAGVDKKDFEVTRGQLSVFQSADDAEQLFCASAERLQHPDHDTGLGHRAHRNDDGVRRDAVMKSGRSHQPVMLAPRS